MVSKLKPYHQLILQGLMSHGYMEEHRFKNLVEIAMDRYDGQKDILLHELVSTLNTHLLPLSLEIRRARTEDTSVMVYGICNSKSDELSHYLTRYSKAELCYFRRLIEEIVLSNNGTQSSIDAVNLINGLNREIKVATEKQARIDATGYNSDNDEGSDSDNESHLKKLRMSRLNNVGEVKLSKTATENLLNRLTTDGWLNFSNGDYLLGPRSILELRPLFSSWFVGAVTTCKGCGEIVVTGDEVQNHGLLHRYCANVMREALGQVDRKPVFSS